jgi:hypothetical protein
MLRKLDHFEVIILDDLGYLKHRAAAELSSRLDQYFQSQAAEARSFAADSRTLAARTQAATSDTFAQAQGLSRDAERLLAKGEYASATRGFLEARDAFDRARRAAEAKPLPTPPPIPPSRTAALPPSVTPGVTLPAAPSVAPPVAPTPPPVTAPPVAARALVAGQTAVEAAKKPGKAPAGFDSGDVLADRDFLCKLSFETNPAEVRPGDSYQVTAYLVNDSAKPVKMKAVALATTVNGSRTPRQASAVKEAPPRTRTALGGLGGVWPDGVTTWVFEAVVTSSKDDTCRNRLTLK